MVSEGSSQTWLISALQQQVFSLIFNCPLRGDEVIELKLKRAGAIAVEIPTKGDCVFGPVNELSTRGGVCAILHIL